MTIATYDDLKSEVASFLARSDLTDKIPTFIQLAEDSFNRRLKLPAMEKLSRVSTTAGDRFVTLPGDYREARRLVVTTDPVTLPELTTIEGIYSSRPSSASGKPAFFAIHGIQIVLAPIPDTAYGLDFYYYANLPALSEDNPTNWMLINAPLAYLSGALTEAFSYTRNEVEAAKHKGRFEEILDQLGAEAAMAHFSGGTAQARVT
ncbi:MAG: hypothetical protein AAGH60_14420 [Pseudomonadota bacterium]